MLARIIGEFSRQLLKVDMAECAHMNLGLHQGLVTSKRLWVIFYGLLYALIQKVGYHGHFRALA